MSVPRCSHESENLTIRGLVEVLNVITVLNVIVLNVITFGPKCNKSLNVITFGPKCNKPPMQSFNCANIEMLK